MQARHFQADDVWRGSMSIGERARRLKLSSRAGHRASFPGEAVAGAVRGRSMYSPARSEIERSIQNRCAQGGSGRAN